MAKYTDEQIKKALECCGAPTTTSKLSCNSCPILGTRNCMALTNRYALDLINRQEAEIEKLKEKNRLANQCTPKAIRRARAEVIKEFAEAIKSYIDAYVVFEYAAGEQDLLDYIDNLVAEMVGESK